MLQNPHPFQHSNLSLEKSWMERQWRKQQPSLFSNLGWFLRFVTKTCLGMGYLWLYILRTYIYICFMYNSSTSMDSYEFSGFLRMEIHRFPSDLLTSRVTKMEPPGLVFDTTRMEELKVARSFWRRSCVVIYSDVPSFMRKHPPQKKQLKIPLSSFVSFFFHPLFLMKTKGGNFFPLFCVGLMCAFFYGFRWGLWDAGRIVGYWVGFMEGLEKPPVISHKWWWV